MPERQLLPIPVFFIDASPWLEKCRLKLNVCQAPAFVPVSVNSAGLPNDKFVFEGFLPVKKGRQTRLTFLAEETRTIIFCESPNVKNTHQFC
jgi:16S rRNA C1402 (ribose-2'-O) methylase RsmI